MAIGRTALRPEDLLENLEWMRRLARALTRGDAAEAEDLTSDAVEAALGQQPLLDGPVRPWLGGVLRNLARLRARAGTRRRQRDATAVSEGSAPSPAELVERVETQRQVAGLVVLLAEPLRSTLLLRYYEGLTAAEVARRLGVPAGTVRWRLKKALDQLRDQLDHSHGGRRQRWSALLLPLSVPVSAPARPRGEPPPRMNVPAILKGGLIVSANGKLLAVGVIVAVAAGVSGLRMRARPPEARVDTALTRRDARPSLGAVMRLAPGGTSLVAVDAPDPDGTFRLEGQVVDEQENPVEGAAVAIDSNPPRTVLTRADGGFVLDNLMPRRYRLEAHAGGLYAGPVETRVSRGSEPLVLRARAGAKLRIQVRDAADGRPVAGAEVTLRSALVWADRTDQHGVATFTGVGPGWMSLRAEAAGFAPAHRVLGGQRERNEIIEVRLGRGAPVVGRVVTPRGVAIAGALVWVVLTSEPFPAVDPRLDAVTSDAQGQWTMPALAAGTYRFEASHPDHAQGGTAPTSIDGGPRNQGIDIALEDGGVVSGQVRRADGTPLGAAQVRAAVKGGVAWRFMRDVFTSTDGRFRLRGLPLRALDIVAMHDEGSSATATLDLSAGPPEQEVNLTISVSGAIDGVVVDGAGSPLAEAQVVAEPERRADVTAMREWDVRGAPSFISDAGGRFRLAGLPAGAYRVRAARAGSVPDAIWLNPGVIAAAGDRNVTVVVPANGTITGRVVYAAGGVPPRFFVEVGQVSEPFASPAGVFTIEVPAGRHDVVVSGPTFTTTHVEDADVEEGTTKDIGALKVERGRSVSGRVLRADGTTVAGADVAAGELLTGDGRKLNIPSEGYGVQETRSDDDGRFSMTGFDETPLMLVAEREGVGRSKSMALPRGPDSAEMDLVLEPTGGVSGVVSRAGAPLPGTVIIANPRGETRSNFLVISGPDGRFDFDMLTAGPYRVSALIGEGGSRPKDMHSNSVTVDEGGHGHVDIDIPAGPVTMSIELRTDSGGAVPAASVIVLTGKAEAPNMEALRDRARTAPDGPAAFYLRDWRASAATPLRITNMTPGTYTVCAIPIPADPARPLEMERAMAHMALRPAVCTVSSLAASSDAIVSIPSAWLLKPN